ncbi:MAG: phaC PHA synthase, partial [Gammaproteobacteria bacterium]|nr:phaC PHA synthase [Gammaproteobacteria bacterium]
MKQLIALFVAAAMLASFSAVAEDATPIQFSFFDFNAPKTKDVSGVRFPAIYGKQGGNVQGADLQLLAWSEMESLKGVSFPLVIAGGNKITGDMTGVSFGLLSWHLGNDTGVNLSAINITNNVKGMNWGVVNVATGYTVADISAVNISKKSNFQLGIFNKTDEIDGV